MDQKALALKELGRRLTMADEASIAGAGMGI
jgi:hypothetical protein